MTLSRVERSHSSNLLREQHQTLATPQTRGWPHGQGLVPSPSNGSTCATQKHQTKDQQHSGPLGSVTSIASCHPLIFCARRPVKKAVASVLALAGASVACSPCLLSSSAPLSPVSLEVDSPAPQPSRLCIHKTRSTPELEVTEILLSTPHAPSPRFDLARLLRYMPACF
ncbi:hypothetical protein VTI74DRAFT_6202 [Chaetomium olivicolor]